MQGPAPLLTASDVGAGRANAAITLPVRLAALAQLGQWVQAVAQAEGLPERCAFRLDLVLAEAVTNIIEHGYPADADGDIRVQITCEPGRVIVQVDDGGRPFDPTATPAHQQPGSLEEAPIGGLGLHLIRSYTEDWQYRRIEQRNRQRMTIACDA